MSEETRSALYSHIPHGHIPLPVNEVQQAERQNLNDRLAVLITKGFGSMAMLYVLMAWMGIWMVLASLGFWLFAADRYPFPFLLFCSNLVQLWALPVLAVGNNVLNRRTELQAEAQFKDVVAILHQNEQTAHHLEAQDQELLRQTTLLLSLMEQGKVSSPAQPRKKSQAKED